MVNHPNRNWRKRWRFDTANLVATHESGLMVKFEQAKDDEMALDGSVVGDIPENLNWRSDARVLTNLMRQAGDGMMEAVEREDKH